MCDLLRSQFLLHIDQRKLARHYVFLLTLFQLYCLSSEWALCGRARYPRELF